MNQLLKALITAFVYFFIIYAVSLAFNDITFNTIGAVVGVTLILVGTSMLVKPLTVYAKLPSTMIVTSLLTLGIVALALMIASLFMGGFQAGSFTQNILYIVVIAVLSVIINLILDRFEQSSDKLEDTKIKSPPKQKESENKKSK